MYIIYLFNFGDININPYQIEIFIYQNWDNIYFLAKFIMTIYYTSLSFPLSFLFLFFYDRIF